jgi:cobalt-zinc-cadmium efflux system outer membrane protein
MNWALFIIFVLSTVDARARELTLREVVSSTRDRHPIVLSNEKEKEIAAGDLVANEGAFDLQWKSKISATRGYYPTERLDSVIEKPTKLWGASLFAGYRLGTGKFAIYDGKQETLSSGELRTGIDVPLWKNGPTDRRRANIERSEQGVKVAQTLFDQSIIENVRNATQRYWEWAIAGERARVYRSLLKAAEDRDAGFAERVLRGDLPKFERRDNERTILQRKAQVIASERTLQQAAIELSLFLRDENGNPQIPMPEHLPTEFSYPEAPLQTPVEEAVQVALARRPEVARFEAQQKQNEIESTLFDNQLAPRVDLQVAASRDLGTGDPSRIPTELEVGMVLEIPLERNVARGRLDTAVAGREKVQLQARMFRERLMSDIRDIQSSLTAAYGRLELNHKEWVLSLELEKGERIRFQHGDSNILFVNLREQATADAAVRKLDALLEYNKGLTAWKAALGQVD